MGGFLKKLCEPLRIFCGSFAVLCVTTLMSYYAKVRKAIAKLRKVE